jgi:tetratricopeptide (TPR) repeat protein
MRQLKNFIILTVILASCEQSTLQQVENAEALREEGKTIKAIERTTEIIKEHNDIQRAYYYRGLCYMDIKQYPKAIADFDKIISLKPVDPSGLVFEYNRNSPFASDELKLTAGFDEVFFHRALSWYFMDSLNNALADFKQCNEQDHEYGLKAVTWAATVYIQLGQKATGCELYKRAMLNGDAEAYELFQKNCP